MSGRSPRLISVTRSKLPEGYTEIAYIRATGTQYIDTGIVCNKSDDYVCTLKAQLENNENFAGGNGYLQYQASIASGQKATIEVAYKNNVETICVDGVLKSTTDWTSSYSGQNVKIGILRMGDAGNTWHSSSPQSGDIYKAEIRRARTLVRDFIPCKSPSGVVGMYDAVGGTFYTNDGTGAFIAGPAA